MAAGYTKEFLVEAALYKYEYYCGVKVANGMRKMFEMTYDKYGKEQFRKYTNLTAERIREYKDRLQPTI